MSRKELVNYGVGAIMVFLSGTWVGYAFGISTMQHNAALSCGAHYDTRTGGFQWEKCP